MSGATSDVYQIATPDGWLPGNCYRCLVPQPCLDGLIASHHMLNNCNRVNSYNLQSNYQSIIQQDRSMTVEVCVCIV